MFAKIIKCGYIALEITPKILNCTNNKKDILIVHLKVVYCIGMFTYSHMEIRGQLFEINDVVN